MLTIRDYQEWDEEAWLRCHALVSLQSAAWSNITRQKPHYKGPAIELVAVLEGEIVGFIDVEVETRPGELCLPGDNPAAQTWEMGVLPSNWGTGIGRELLREMVTRLRFRSVRRLEFWTRDQRTKGFFVHMGATHLRDYYQIRLDTLGTSLEDELRLDNIAPVSVLAHISPQELAKVEAKYNLIEKTLCAGFELRL